jgi:hypothetical protein
MNAKPISEQTKPSSGIGCLVLVGLIFAAAGLFFFWFITLSPFLQARASADWVQAECEITFSELDIDRSGDGTTYRPDIHFSYNVDGQEYESETFDFTELNQPRSRCEEIIQQHPVGQQEVCFYNPNQADEAVIEKSYRHSWFATLFSLGFVGIGLGLAVLPVFSSKKKDAPISGSIGSKRNNSIADSLAPDYTLSLQDETVNSHLGDVKDSEWDKPQKLKPKMSRWVGLLVVSGLATFWNSIVGIFLFQTIKDGLNGGFELFSVMFLLPFVLIGLLLILGVFYQLISLFNPKVELALSSGAVPLGGTVDVAWQLTGKISRIKRLFIYVEGKESATYRAGTSSHTDHEVFSEIVVVNTDSRQDFEFGSQTVQIPIDTMHTFEADKNKITWSIRVHGDIPWSPDVDETYPFRVKPK